MDLYDSLLLQAFALGANIALNERTSDLLSCRFDRALALPNTHG